MASRYHEVYDNWKRDPQAFWAAAAEEIQPWMRRALLKLAESQPWVICAGFPVKLVSHLESLHLL